MTFPVRDRGPAAGEPVILLHGFPERASSRDQVGAGLAAHGCRVLALDQRGYAPGARPHHRTQYRTEELVGDVLALADAARLRRFHLVGHDWGGAIAWHVASGHPERVSSLTVLSTPHPRALVAAATRSTQLLRSSYVAFFRTPVLPELVLGAAHGRMLSLALRRSGLDAASAEEAVAAMAEPGALRGALGWYRAASLDGVGPVDVPTTYVWSTGDTALGRKAAERTRDWVTGEYRFVVLEGVSHWIHHEVPERVVELARERIRSH